MQGKAERLGLSILGAVAVPTLSLISIVTQPPAAHHILLCAALQVCVVILLVYVPPLNVVFNTQVRPRGWWFQSLWCSNPSFVWL